MILLYPCDKCCSFFNITAEKPTACLCLLKAELLIMYSLYLYVIISYNLWQRLPIFGFQRRKHIDKKINNICKKLYISNNFLIEFSTHWCYYINWDIVIIHIARSWLIMIKYDKLIRDKIPEIIEQSGKKCIVEVKMLNGWYFRCRSNALRVWDICVIQSISVSFRSTRALWKLWTITIFPIYSHTVRMHLIDIGVVDRMSYHYKVSELSLRCYKWK